MTEQKRSSIEIESELKAAVELATLLVKSLEEKRREVAEAEKVLYELRGGWHTEGKIARLRSSLEAAKLREETERLPTVRVTIGRTDAFEPWAFVKKTPKRIYLRRLSSMRDEHFDLDGRSSWEKIHPEDVALILSGALASAPQT